MSSKGMTLIDRYKGRSQIDYSFIPFGGTRNYNNDANNYRIVLVPLPPAP